MKQSLRFVLLVFGLVLSLDVWSLDYESFIVDGIGYSMLSESERTVAVTDYAQERQWVEYAPATKKQAPRRNSIGTWIYVYKDITYSGKVVIPATVTYDGITYTVTKIEDGALANNNSNVTSLTIPYSVNELSHWDSSPESTNSLRELIFEDGDTEINWDDWISPFDGQSIETLYLGRNVNISAFTPYGTSLKKVTIGDKVTSLSDHLFEECSLLREIHFGKNITSMGVQVFALCTSLTEIDLTSKLSTIPNSTFYDCTSLKTVILPEGLTSTEDFAFSGCSSLTYINLPQGLSSIGCDCFEGTAITQIRVPNSVTFMDHRAFDECTQLKDVIFEDGDISLTVSRDNSGSDMFSNCPIDSIYIGRNIADSYGYFPDINIESLRTLYFGDSATRLGCWRGATNLSSVHLGKNIAHPEEYSFAECTSLKHIEFPENLGAVFYRTFYNCTALESVVLPTNAEYLGGKLFEGCTSLKSVTIPGKVIEIGYYAFSGCTSLETVVFEDGENDLAIEADYSSRDIFWACPLDSVYLGRNITRKASGTYTCQPYFPQCLKKLTIGSGVSKQWDSSWFSYCTNLKHIYPLWDKPIKTNKDMFPNNVYTSATLHVPGGTMKKYQATSAWSKFANIVPTSIGVRLTATEGGNLKIGDEVVSDGTKLLLLKPNSTLTFEVTTKDEYFLESLTMNGEDVTAQVVDGLFSTNDLSVDIEVVATFTAKPFYEVTAAAQEGGTAVVGSSSVMWGHGTTVTFTANEGYELVNVTVNGEDKINEIVNGILTLQDIKENIVVAATFEKFRYAITATDSENGSIGLSTSEAEWGDDVTVTLTPDAHYDINTVIVNGEDYTTALVGNQLTLHNVRSAMNVEATFSIQKFTVTASANAGGNIGLSAANNDDENMNMTVEWGSSVTVTIAADAEYELTNLFVDGEDVKSQVAGGQYTITSIEKDMTIEAVFKEIMEITLIDGKDYSRNNSKYYETINYVRMFDDTSWQTWYAPFDVTLTDEVMEHFDFAKFAGTYTDDKGSFYITIVRLKDGDVVKANTPYCIQAKMANSTPQVITQTDVTLEVAEENSFYVLSAEKRITFQGIYTNRAITETDQDVYAMIGGQYHKQSSDNSLVPFRCFFTMEDREDNPYAATPNPATVKLMVVGDDDIATSIGETYNSTSANGTY